MPTPRAIGVLGGMGPEATILFQQKMLAQVRATDDADHIPLLIDMNPQVPSRIAYLIEGTGTSPGPVIAGMAQRLETAGAAGLVMPCNTAHVFANAVIDAVDIPLLNIVELAADHAAGLLGHGGSVGLLASPAVFRTRLYDAALEQRGLKAIWPRSFDVMLRAIRSVKSGRNMDSARQDLAQISGELLRNGADIQIIACSEFSIIADSVAADARAFDSLDELAKAAAGFSLRP